MRLSIAGFCIFHKTRTMRTLTDTWNIGLLCLLCCFSFACKEEKRPVEKAILINPVEDYGPLFSRVQQAVVFPDSKTFADCSPKAPVAEILAAYEQIKDSSDAVLPAFVEKYFEIPHAYASGFSTNPEHTVSQHIQALWPVLTREADALKTGTLIPLPKSYIVPGGRFGEVYYWDSYFTMLGLEVSPEAKPMIGNMVDNFAYLLDTQGFIPNGNRTYYLTRSQPPFFSMMVRLWQQADENTSLAQYLPAMEKEYAFWMDGESKLSQNTSVARHTVRLKGGEILNRYWSGTPKPRPESYKEDVALAQESDQAADSLYQNLRAACESGWDFSTRWFRDEQNLSTIRTTELIPVDLNCLMWHLEEMMVLGYQEAGLEGKANEMKAKSKARMDAILTYCWNPNLGIFTDYDILNEAPVDIPTLAMVFPLYMNMASEVQATSVANFLREKFLAVGGLPTTLNRSGQQWDAPNGWAPLQWMAIEGLRRSGQKELGEEIKQRWVSLNERVFKETGKLVEKYNVMDDVLEGGGGEYPLQDGFGWTNGVLLRLLTEQSN